MTERHDMREMKPTTTKQNNDMHKKATHNAHNNNATHNNNAQRNAQRAQQQCNDNTTKTTRQRQHDKDNSTIKPSVNNDEIFLLYNSVKCLDSSIEMFSSLVGRGGMAIAIRAFEDLKGFKGVSRQTAPTRRCCNAPAAEGTLRRRCTTLNCKVVARDAPQRRIL